MDMVLKHKKLTDLIIGQNVRDNTDVDIYSLQADIEDRGLITPLLVFDSGESKNGQVEVLCGHRRRLALTRIREESKGRFGELFSGGQIPMLVVSGISREKAQTLKVDTGSTVELGSALEVQRCANLLFDDGATEPQVGNYLSALLTRTSKRGGMSKENKDAIAALKADREKAKGKGQMSLVRDTDRRIYDFYAKYHRGHVQALHNVYRSPSLVAACKEFEATGKAVKGFPNVVTLTNDQVKSLYKAFELDLEVKDKNDLPKYSKLRPGPQFLAQFDKIVERKKSGKKGSGKAAVKSMSAKKIVAEITEKWSSDLARKLCQHHAGQKVTGIKKLDAIAVTAEVVEAHRPNLWIKVEAEFEKITKELTEKETVEKS